MNRGSFGAVVGAVVMCVLAAGCSSSPTAGHSTDRPSASQTPVEAAKSWFRAINTKDKAEAVAHFQSSAQDQMDWGSGDTTGWPTFSSVRCHLVNENERDAAVYCSFSESDAPDVGNPDSFWTIELQRQLGKPWLITGYGQG